LHPYSPSQSISLLPLILIVVVVVVVVVVNCPPQLLDKYSLLEKKADQRLRTARRAIKDLDEAAKLMAETTGKMRLTCRMMAETIGKMRLTCRMMAETTGRTRLTCRMMAKTR